MQVLAEFIMEQVDTIFNINIFNLERISTNYTKLDMEYTGYIKGNTDTQTTLLKTAGKQHVCRVPFWTADVSEVLC